MFKYIQNTFCVMKKLGTNSGKFLLDIFFIFNYFSRIKNEEWKHLFNVL